MGTLSVSFVCSVLFCCLFVDALKIYTVDIRSSRKKLCNYKTEELVKII